MVRHDCRGNIELAMAGALLLGALGAAGAGIGSAHSGFSQHVSEAGQLARLQKQIRNPSARLAAAAKVADKQPAIPRGYSARYHPTMGRAPAARAGRRPQPAPYEHYRSPPTVIAAPGGRLPTEPVGPAPGGPGATIAEPLAGSVGPGPHQSAGTPQIIPAPGAASIINKNIPASKYPESSAPFSNEGPGQNMPDNPTGAVAGGTYVSGHPTFSYGVGNPGMVNMAGQGPSPQVASRPEAIDRKEFGAEGFNQEDLIRHSHASYVAYVNRYNTVYR